MILKYDHGLKDRAILINLYRRGIFFKAGFQHIHKHIFKKITNFVTIYIHVSNNKEKKLAIYIYIYNVEQYHALMQFW